MRALLDADMIAHEYGHLHKKETYTNEVGEKLERTVVDDGGSPVPLDWDTVVPMAKSGFMGVLGRAEAGGFRAFLTTGRCHRHDIASIQPYKGNRKDAPREHADKVKELLHDVYAAKWCIGYEADDALAMAGWKEYTKLSKIYDDEEDKKTHTEIVLVTRDKDLDTVPGWHRSWALMGKTDPDPYWLTQVEATRTFYKQVLTGDPTDNILGLFGVGKSSKLLKDLDGMTNEQDMWDHVEHKYQQRFKAYAHKFLLETCQLLWLWRRLNDEFVPPYERTEDWEL